MGITKSLNIIVAGAENQIQSLDKLANSIRKSKRLAFEGVAPAVTVLTDIESVREHILDGVVNVLVITETIDSVKTARETTISLPAIPKDLESWNGSTITNDVVMIYYYGRDYAGVDYLWSMEKKNSGQSNEADERLYYEDLTDEKQWYYDAVVSCLILRGMTRKKALEIAKAYNLRDRLDKYDNLQMHYDVEVVADEVILYSNTRRGSVKKD